MTYLIALYFVVEELQNEEFKNIYCNSIYKMHSQRHLANMYGLTKGCEIEFEHTKKFQYTGWLANTGNSFQFTLKNARTDSEIEIGEEGSLFIGLEKGVFTVQSIQDTKIEVSKFDIVMRPRIEVGVITADLQIVPPQTTNDIVRKLQLDSADGRQRISKAFKSVGIRTFGLEQDAKFFFRKEGADLVGNVPGHEKLVFTFKELMYHDVHEDHYETLNVRPDIGCIRVIVYDGKRAVFGLLERGLYINRPGRIYVDLTLRGRWIY